MKSGDAFVGMKRSGSQLLYYIANWLVCIGMGMGGERQVVTSFLPSEAEHGLSFVCALGGDWEVPLLYCLDWMYDMYDE